MSSKPLISLQGVNKRFGEQPDTLSSIDLSLDQGEFLAIIGPSGCGKSTLLKLVAGLMEPSSGELLIDGQQASQNAGQMGFVFQDANLMPWSTISNNVALPLKLQGVDAEVRASRAAEMLDLVNLAGAGDKFPRELSGGMKMRVSIARALATNPEILLLDEPFGALDEMTRDSLNEELLRLREIQQWTAMFVTHSVAEAVFLSSKVLVLSANPGRVHALLDIDLPFPRTAETRTETTFHEHVATVTRSLHSVMGGSH